MAAAEHIRVQGIRRGVASFLVIVAGLFLLAAPVLGALGPADTVKTGTEKVIQILRSMPKDHTRREAIRKVVDTYFDFKAMGRSALGPYWKEQSPEKQQEFTREFSEFLFNIYLTDVERYTNQKILYRELKSAEDRANVETVIVLGNGRRITINYRLALENGNWRAYDVLVEGVSLVENYRGQFRSILSKYSFENLLDRLRQRNAQRA